MERTFASVHYSLESLPYPRHKGVKHRKDFALDKPLLIAEEPGRTCLVPVGTTVRLWQGENFGYVLLPEGTTPWGSRLFRY